MEGVKEGRVLRFSIDRGGTFTDVFAEVIPCMHRCIVLRGTHGHI